MPDSYLSIGISLEFLVTLKWETQSTHELDIVNCQTMYRLDPFMGRTHTDGPDEFEPSKFDCT